MTGLIFGAITAAWVVYLVPYMMRRRAEPEVESLDPAEPFSSSVTIVRRGSSLATAEAGTAIVSTPLTRRAALYELRQIDLQAAARRRRVLAGLMVVLSVTCVLGGFKLASWWYSAVPGGLLVAFLIVSRFSVRIMRRNLAQRAARVRVGYDEETVAIKVVETASLDRDRSVELAAPTRNAGSLWEPIPIAKPTYVSQPLAPRTVRTIDLSAPVPAPTSTLPVVAEAQNDQADSDAASEASRLRAVGE